MLTYPEHGRWHQLFFLRGERTAVAEEDGQNTHNVVSRHQRNPGERVKIELLSQES